jgi:hypothetical protein
MKQHINHARRVVSFELKTSADVTINIDEYRNTIERYSL